MDGWRILKKDQGNGLVFAFAVVVGVAVVKAYERHQDVLYGPYIKAARLKQRPR
jgi:hypothetical protein